MQTQEWILHVDGDAFFASVYQAIHPEAKGRPVAIGAVETQIAQAEAQGLIGFGKCCL
jgi:nucleotidyltransferase/DNA polymerase involved in DNA repair